MILCGCAKPDDGRKQTTPLTGEVYVDNQPAAGVHVKFHEVKGMDTANPTVSATITNDAGKFAASTYDEGDGVPEGEYTVTFEWSELNKFSMQYEGDKLNGKYSNPEKSDRRVKVANGKPTDLGRI